MRAAPFRGHRAGRAHSDPLTGARLEWPPEVGRQACGRPAAAALLGLTDRSVRAPLAELRVTEWLREEDVGLESGLRWAGWKSVWGVNKAPGQTWAMTST